MGRMSCLYKPSPTVKNMDMVNLTTACNSNSWGGGRLTTEPSLHPFLCIHYLLEHSPAHEPSRLFCFCSVFLVPGIPNDNVISLLLFSCSKYAFTFWGGFRTYQGLTLAEFHLLLINLQWQEWHYPHQYTCETMIFLEFFISLCLLQGFLKVIFHFPVGGDLSQYAGGVSFPPWQQLLPFSDSEKWNKVPCCQCFDFLPVIPLEIVLAPVSHFMSLLLKSFTDSF